jgi:peptidoglycan/LPS O-acetylase OafA/YrhL
MPEKNRILIVDGLRGFLAVYVFLFHFHNFYQFHGSMELISKVFSMGGGAPYIFFVISGFLLTRSYLSTAPASYGKFYLKRFFRIFPTYWVICILTLILGQSSPNISLLPNFTLTIGFLPYDFKDLLLPVSWSLFVEEIYYITTPFLVPYLSTIITGALYLLFLELGSIWYMIESKYQFWGQLRYETPFNTFDFFFAGIFIYNLYSQGLFNQKNWPKKSIYLLELATLILTVVYLLKFKINLSVLGVFLLATALLEKNIFEKFLWSRRVFIWAGSRCYSLYLSHIMAIEFVAKYFDIKNEYNNLEVMLILLLTSASVTIFAEIVYRTCERPFIRIGKHLMNADI